MLVPNKVSPSFRSFGELLFRTRLPSIVAIIPSSRLLSNVFTFSHRKFYQKLSINIHLNDVAVSRFRHSLLFRFTLASVISFFRVVAKLYSRQMFRRDLSSFLVFFFSFFRILQEDYRFSIRGHLRDGRL